MPAVHSVPSRRILPAASTEVSDRTAPVCSGPASFRGSFEGRRADTVFRSNRRDVQRSRRLRKLASELPARHVVVNIDSAVQKIFPIAEKANVTLRGEFFNLLNHPNFGLPGSNVAAPNTLGVINGASDPRIVQIGALLSF
jgi:hypothetical protein